MLIYQCYIIRSNFVLLLYLFYPVFSVHVDLSLYKLKLGKQEVVEISVHFASWYQLVKVLTYFSRAENAVYNFGVIFDVFVFKSDVSGRTFVITQLKDAAYTAW